jgi:hypothetical protein
MRLHFPRTTPVSLLAGRLPSAPLLGALALATLALGCSDIETPGSLSQEESHIVNGEKSDAADDGVVYVGRPGGAACTGSVIAPNVILTALHCVADTKQDSGFVCRSDGTISPTSPVDGKLGGLLDPTEFYVRTGVEYHAGADAHGKKLFGTGSNVICTNDLAVMIIDTDLDVPIVPLRFGRSIERGEIVRAVGYGQTETSGSSGRFVRHDIRVLDVGADLMSPGSTTAVPRTMVVGEGPCHGDSGGPALSEETNAVIGVSSILNGANCRSPGVTNIFTQVSPFESLIRKALTEAGHEPVLEVDPNAGGEGGAGGNGDVGGAPGNAGAGNEPQETGGAGDVPNGAGGSNPATGGTGAVGGTQTTDGGTGGSANETGATAGTNGSQGSGSRRSGCACRMAPEPGRHMPAGLIGGLFAVLGFAARRRFRSC